MVFLAVESAVIIALSLDWFLHHCDHFAEALGSEMGKWIEEL